MKHPMSIAPKVKRRFAVAILAARVVVRVGGQGETEKSRLQLMLQSRLGRTPPLILNLDAR